MKSRSSYVCQQCGYESPSWYGKCPGCGEWNTLIETIKKELKFQKSNFKTTTQISKPQRLSDVRHIEKNRLKSGFSEFDRVVGGGIVPGSVILLAGDPGIGNRHRWTDPIRTCRHRCRPHARLPSGGSSLHMPSHRNRPIGQSHGSPVQSQMHSVPQRRSSGRNR